MESTEQAPEHRFGNIDASGNNVFIHQGDNYGARSFSREHECLQAFKSCNYDAFKDVNPPRAPNTCRWVLDHPQYQNWLQSEGDDLLWISADPGCGKSVLSKALVDDIPRPVQVTICHFFFKDNELQSSLATALCAILHQLFSHEPHLIQFALPGWEHNGGKLAQESSALWSVFLKAAGSAIRPVICVLDALDECVQADRSQLIRMLCDFHKEASSGSHKAGLKFLATSRPYDDVRRWFTDTIVSCPTIWLRGDEENDKINEEINVVIDSQVRKLAAEYRLEDELQERLQSSLKNMGHRTYLWLHLTLDSLRDQIQASIDPDRIRIEDISLPETVEQAYEALLSRVKDHLRERVRKVFLIIIGARRPFTSEEMFLALAVSFPEAGRGPNTKGFVKARFEGQIREWCGLFIFIKDSKLFLIHQTAKEFLLSRDASIVWTPSRNLEAGALTLFTSEFIRANIALLLKKLAEFVAVILMCVTGLANPVLASRGACRAWKSCLTTAQVEYEMACICVDYLCLEIDEGFLDVDYGGDKAATIYVRFMEASRQEGAMNSLYLYCADNWNLHLLDNAISTRRPIFRKVLRLYQHQDAKHLLPKWVSASGSLNQSSLRSLTHGDSSLSSRWGSSLALRRPPILAQHLMAYSGHSTVLKHLSEVSEVDWEAEDAEGRTALVYAVAMGHIGTIDFLVEQNANVYCEPRHGIGYSWGKSEPPLVYAVRNRDLHVVESLLRTRSHVENALKGKKRALETAAGLGDVSLLQMLLEADASLDCEALHEASRRNHQDAVRCLLSVGANVNRRNKSGRSPLEAAARLGSVPLLRLLFEAGASLDCEALHEALRGNSKDAVRYLLSVGANVNHLDKYGKAPLEIAIKDVCLEIMQTLIDANADVNVSSNEGTLVHAALRLEWDSNYSYHCERSLWETRIRQVVRVLLKAGTDMNADSPYGTALHLAAEQGRLATVQVLVKAGADVNVGGPRGTALQLASQQGKLAVVQFLLEAGVGVRAGCQYSIALAAASEHGHEAVVKALLDAAAGLDGLRYHQACHNALNVAVRCGHKVVVKALLDATTQLDSFDYGQVYYNPLGVGRSTFVHGETVEMLSDAAIAFMLPRVVSGQLPVSTGQELLTNVCDVDDHVVRLAIQQEHIDWMDAINAIKSLKDALAQGSNEALARSIEVFLPSPARQKADVKLLIDRWAYLDQPEKLVHGAVQV
ncbi:hypothetical protein LTR70_003941 [Exophiala xenobiotica]|uniref:Uncharacterized protein n=1 Tax=Lithohypha guttulata TaxID=1690604 RepID=A0ABR0K9X2_9EURO|nr:hypothetical protein LTR24_005295 [Lithohypha guttulata]KAK5322094.1 hypothetical protein LTR70_003941 [Exophiala xenobiotica]